MEVCESIYIDKCIKILCFTLIVINLKRIEDMVRVHIDIAIPRLLYMVGVHTWVEKNGLLIK